MIDAAQADSVREWITKGQEGGASLIAGGLAPPEDLPTSCNPAAFMRPTIFADVTDNMGIAKEELFGPVASVLKFSDTEEVLQRANTIKHLYTKFVISSKSR